MICNNNHLLILSKALRKKGGIFIKKILFFLILLTLFFIPNLSAKAATFYEAEWIPGIYLKRHNFNTGLTYYQQARFYRNAENNEYVYCIEPFLGIVENEPYTETINPSHLSKEKIKRISNIAYYGYQYGDHTDDKWYAITQLMIWQAADEAGNFFFTKTLNGASTNIYTSEITEINHLIEINSILPSFAANNYEIVEGNTLILEDSNQVLGNFHTNEGEINGNMLTIKNLQEGEYEIPITKKQSMRGTPTLFYLSNNSQNMVKTGNIEENNTNIKVKVTKTSLELNKIDKDTESTTPQGEASLDGALYQLSNENKEIIEEIKIINNEARIENLDFGKYYLQELEAGEGYTIDPTIYEINITKENPNVTLQLKNEVIKANITLEKKYGENDNWKKENNISFEIKNQNNETINTITTNENGIAKITLPYGIYTINQINTTEGYEKIEPVILEIKDSEEKYLSLKDIRIAVPNTHKDEVRIQYRILLEIICLLLL